MTEERKDNEQWKQRRRLKTVLKAALDTLLIETRVMKSSHQAFVSKTTISTCMNIIHSKVTNDDAVLHAQLDEIANEANLSLHVSHSIVQRRRSSLRSELRHLHLARAFLSRRSYSAVEQHCHIPPDPYRLHRMLHQYTKKARVKEEVIWGEKLTVPSLYGWIYPKPPGTEACVQEATL